MTNTLWGAGGPVDKQMLAYTVADDRTVDARLIRWDILGSLGHIEGLPLPERERRSLGRALRAALKAADDEALTIGRDHEDVHSAVEFWLTKNHGDVGLMVHAGR
jgi:argininosuccinate lyase